jgi:hypothetical protein
MLGKKNASILMWCGERPYIFEFMKADTIQENYMEMKA